MKNPNEKKQVSVSVDRHYIEKIKKHAAMDGRSMANFLGMIVSREIDRLEKKS